MNTETIQTITAELGSAYQAQAGGNLGRARVCARRAAGWAIQAYLEAAGDHPAIPNALDSIKYLAEQPNLPPEIAKVLDHLILRVVKDSMETDAYYPLADVDLVAEAHWLAEHLLGVRLSPEKL